MCYNYCNYNCSSTLLLSVVCSRVPSYVQHENIDLICSLLIVFVFLQTQTQQLRIDLFFVICVCSYINTTNWSFDHFPYYKLDSFSKADFEQACLRIGRRFPLLSREDGSHIRRTVAVEDRFHHSRHFLFVSLGFVDVGRLELLISTISTDLVGLRGEGKLLIFYEGLLAKKEELAVDCGLIPEDVIYVDLEIPDESLYFHPLRAHFKEAVNGLIKYLAEETYCKKHLGNCLTFLYALIMRGAIFTRGKGVVEVALVKAASKVEAGDMLDDEMLHVIDLIFKARLVFRFKSLSKRAVATKAWEMAKAGYDKEEYFDEEKFEDEEEEATARWAWDLGALPITKTSLKNELKKWDDGF